MFEYLFVYFYGYLVFDNSFELKGLVVLQAALTTLGNICLAFAAWNLFRTESSRTN